MANVEKQTHINEHEYLEGELASDIKHELIDGHVYAMAGASANHERISRNILIELGLHLKNTPCEPFGSDMKVKTGQNFFYPDIVVDCDFDESQAYYTESPVIIVEVLSRSTRKTDETTKRLSYINMPTLQEYVLIEQDVVDIEVVRRSDDWRSQRYYMGDTINFESIGLTISVEDIYHRVKNDDVDDYHSNKA